MAGKQVNFEVNVDSSDGIKGLRDFSRAAQKAGKDAAKSLDETATAGDKARTAIKQMADVMDSELRGAAAAADALGKALGPELAGRMDVTQVVLDLEKMGVTFDEIRLEADQFATTLRDIDGIRVQQVNDGLDTTKTKMGALRDSSDQTRSVMANLAGNAAQDLGELGGVAGTTGVFIGQLAEYATEGNIAFRNLVAAAAPMIGILAAVKLAGNVMKFFGRDTKIASEEFKTMVEHLKDGQSALEASNELLAETGELLSPDNIDDSFIRELAEGFLGWEEGALNLNEVLLGMGSTFDEWSRAVTGSSTDARDYTLRLKQAAEQGQITEEQERDMVTALFSSRTAWQDAGHEVDQYNQLTTPTVRSIEELNTALAGQESLMLSAAQNWRIIAQDMADGAIDTQAAADAVNIMQEYLGLENDEMDELVKQKTDDYMLEVAAAEEEAAAEALALQEALADLSDVVIDIDTDDLANVSSALTEMLDAGDATVDFQSIKEELRGAFAELETTIAEADVEIDWAKVLDTSQDTGLPAEVLSAIAGVRDQFQEGITAAFDIGGAGAAQHFADTFIPALMAASPGMTIEQARQIVGLPADGNIAVALQPYVDAEAKADALAILDALAGVDPNNPILAMIRLGLETGDIDPQVAEVAARLLAAEALKVPADLEGFTQAEIDEATALIRNTPIDVPVQPVLVGMDRLIAEMNDPRMAQGTATIEAPAAQTVTVTAELDPGTVDRELDDLADDRTATIKALATQLLKAKSALDAIAVQRIADIFADPTGEISAKAALNAIAKPRTAPINADVRGEAEAERILERLARRRDAYIYTHTVSTGSGGGGAAPGPGTLAVGPMAMAAEGEDDGLEAGVLAAPTLMASSVPASGVAVVSTAPTINNMSVTVQAAVIGNRHEVERTVAKALKSYVRLNGSRN